jgi:hypothetical protein
MEEVLRLVDEALTDLEEEKQEIEEKISKW